MGKKIVPDQDMVFFDEIQECPRTIMALRYFYEEKSELHIIAAGSLLEFAFKDISFPVGRLQMLSMYPLTFEEYLLAIGNDLLADIIKNYDSQLSETIIKIVMIPPGGLKPRPDRLSLHFMFTLVRYSKNGL